MFCYDNLRSSDMSMKERYVFSFVRWTLERGGRVKHYIRVYCFLFCFFFFFFIYTATCHCGVGDMRNLNVWGWCVAPLLSNIFSFLLFFIVFIFMFVLFFLLFFSYFLFYVIRVYFILVLLGPSYFGCLHPCTIVFTLLLFIYLFNLWFLFFLFSWFN